ncbi:hypothetical protein B9Z19DRAFT_1190926 [Tuber borchii]|uniref:Uncharacterized protein n=1 Tax=Tuber borchii TaxID=42251 RepID=A0A2T7A1J8_TUBBO|nr:hypothetical protein B9Z19DRAFT_1190926 [Tuber borchii]
MPLEQSIVNVAPFTSQIFAHGAPPKTINYLRDGLVGVDRLQYHGPHSFETAIGKHINGFLSNRATQYVVFSPITQQEFEDIKNIRNAHHKELRLMHIGNQKTLIIKCGASVVHQLANRVFARCFEEKLFEMGLNSELEPMGTAMFSGPGSEKQADSAFKPSSRPFVDDWPTLVFECGVSESLGRLQVDAQWWLENSAGDVKTVIVISYSLPERSIHLEKWELADTPHPSDPSIFPPTITEEADIIGEKVLISAKGVPKISFVIDFTKIMLFKPLVRRGQDNFTFSKKDLVDFAGRIWRNSQTRPASDSDHGVGT